MYIRTTKSAHSKNTYVYLVEGFRDKNGKVKQRIVKNYGILEELQKDDPDILTKLKKQAKLMDSNVVSIDLNLTEKNSDSDIILNYGSFFLEGLYDSLKIPNFIKKTTKKYKHQYDFNEILKLLIISRILHPASKKETHEKRERFFNKFNFTLDDVYRSLDIVNDIKDDLQLHLHQEITKQYNRDCTLVFYDVTNYYFETEEQDELRAKGVSKENRKSSIVQMGLFIDNHGIPIAYKLFRGNQQDTTTLIPILEEFKKKYNLGKIIVTADKGLNSGKNLAYISNNQDGYIVSQQVRRTKKEFIEYVLDDSDYVYNEKRTFKMKSFIRERKVKNDEGKLVPLKEKVLCFWSKAYAERETHKRGDIEDLIQNYLDNPSKYNASNRFGVKKYLKQNNVDKETGEVSKPKYKLHFEQEKYERDRALDGYYCIITSELNLTGEEIIEKYRGLWKIEDSFRVMKSDLEGRPVHVWTQEHIEAHFLTCYIALIITRILQYKLNYRYSAKQIQEALNSANCLPINKDLFILNKRANLYNKIEKLFNVSLDLKHARIEQIRNYRKEILLHNK